MYDYVNAFIDGEWSTWKFIRKMGGIKKALQEMRAKSLYLKDINTRSGAKIEELTKDIKKLLPVYSIEFSPQPYNFDAGAYVIKHRDSVVTRATTREAAEAFVELCKKEKYEDKEAKASFKGELR